MIERIISELNQRFQRALTPKPRRVRRAFEFHRNSRKDAKAARREKKQVFEDLAARTHQIEQELERYPGRAWPKGGHRRATSGHGMKKLRVRGASVTAHTAATAFPFVAGPSLGWEGVLLGRDRHGGGPFVFDPWVLYKKRIISGMSMMLFGQVGMGKSSLAKSMAIRLVLLGRKLSVASDKKGEWTVIVRALGGAVIQIGPGLDDRLNPLDPGVRPSVTKRGHPMSDTQWSATVRSRRMGILATVVKIIDGHGLDSAKYRMLIKALNMAVVAAGESGEAPVIPQLVTALEELRFSEEDHERSRAANLLALTLHRLTDGDMAGMFDGPTTVDFDGSAPAVSIDTSTAQDADPLAARIINACAGAWMESMVTHSDGGQRVIVYEEGWEGIAHEAELQRMMERWKLARAYGIFNLLIMHKVTDLNMAADEGSRMMAMAKSLLADSDIKVIYRQDASALKVTQTDLDLSERERGLLLGLEKGVGLWRVGQATFEVENERTAAEVPLLDTDERMDSGDHETAAVLDEEQLMDQDYVQGEVVV